MQRALRERPPMHVPSGPESRPAPVQFRCRARRRGLNRPGGSVESWRNHNRRFGNRHPREESMRRLLILVLGILALAATSRFAAAEDTLKVAVPQKGAW